MKKMLLIAVGITLSITGCQSVQTTDSKRMSIIETVQSLKANGCEALPELERRILVLAIKSQVPNYPVNGICDPRWVEKELIKQIDKLEATTNTTLWLRANPLIDLTPESIEQNDVA
jgi:hypothetical protein